MTAFDQAWLLLKSDFFADKKNIGSRSGVHYPPRRLNRGIMRGKTSPALQEGKEVKDIGPDTRLTPSGHYVGANIAGLREDPSQKELEHLGSVVGHEMGHSLIEDETRAAAGGDEQKYRNMTEWGAQHLQFPGGTAEDQRAREQYKNHPGTTLPETRRRAFEGAMSIDETGAEGGWDRATRESMMTAGERGITDEIRSTGKMPRRIDTAGLTEGGSGWRARE